MFEKILVPLDGSKHSIYALETAIQIAKKFNGKITLIHAYTTHLVPMPKEYVRAESAPEVLEVSGEMGAKILTDAKDTAEHQGVQVETMIVIGKAVDVIIQAANEGKFDLIVIGARGLSPVKEILLGSVSHGVTTRAQCLVLVAK